MVLLVMVVTVYQVVVVDFLLHQAQEQALAAMVAQV
jgi:hypothetical protein